MGSVPPPSPPPSASSSTTTLSLSQALQQYHKRYHQTHPQSLDTHRKATQYLPGGNTRTVLHTTPFPLAIASGSDCHLTTVDGITYTDFLAEYTAGIYGHSHPVIKTAIQTALDAGWNYGGQNALEWQLAKRVVERFPAIELVRFVNSGTEANMLALATALAYSGGGRKRKVLVFKNGYHGSTISGKPSSPLNLPYDFIFANYNDISDTKSQIDALDPPAKETLSAILAEPMLGSGGCYAATPLFLQYLRTLADETNALLIFDEVMTSRLGYHGLGSKMGITPDLMTLGKWVGGGMSFGAFGGRREIMSLFDPRPGHGQGQEQGAGQRHPKLEHPGTFNNNVFSMSAGIAGCDLLSEAKLGALSDLGDLMRRKIEDILAERGVTSQDVLPVRPVDDDCHSPEHPQRPPKMFVRGVGSLMAIQFAGPDRELLQGLFWQYMLLERGIYLAQRGFVALNIMLERVHVDRFVAAVEAFVGLYEPFLRW